MIVVDSTDTTVVQTQDVPMTDMAAVWDHLRTVQTLVLWDQIGVLMDEGPQAIVTVLLDDGEVVSALRFCLSAEDSVAALRAYSKRAIASSELRCWQGRTLAIEQIRDLTALTGVWRESRSQSKSMADADWKKFFQAVDHENQRKGRGRSVKTRTRNQVLLDSHGRCMFDGCARDLTEDSITHERGNFATLAHNVASSEQGPRGVLYLSDDLANDPQNILLLCDTHHRLVDAIAKADYPASVLSDMRRRFCEMATERLDGLGYEPISAFGVAWPVHRQRISLPSSEQAGRALRPMRVRLKGRLQTVSDNEMALRSGESGILWRVMADAIERTAEGVSRQAHGERYRAALFAMGPMPALIALGAKLGNKCDIIPMLRCRDRGEWHWPASEPRGRFYTIEGLDGLTSSEGEVCLSLRLTAAPVAIRSMAAALGMAEVSVVADRCHVGNGALGHPDDGGAFRQNMQELLHRLVDTHGVRRVHVMPCASNAACVFFGQAFDSHHPELIIYEMAQERDHMIPRLRVVDQGNAPVVTAA